MRVLSLGLLLYGVDIIFLTLLFIRGTQCRKNMGLLLTGVGDKVVSPVHRLQNYHLHINKLKFHNL